MHNPPRRIISTMASVAMFASVAMGASGSAVSSVTDSEGEHRISVSELPTRDAGTVASISAAGDAAFDSAGTPEITVVKDPEPVVAATGRGSATARNVSFDASAISTAPAGSILAEAEKYIGVPYVAGGSSTSGFDCSGFTQYVYAMQGIAIPRTTDGQLSAGTVVSDPQPGDIIYSPGHVAIYAGDGMMIDAPRPGKAVQYRAMWQTSPIYVRF